MFLPICLPRNFGFLPCTRKFNLILNPVIFSLPRIIIRMSIRIIIRIIIKIRVIIRIRIETRVIIRTISKIRVIIIIYSRIVSRDEALGR